MAAKSIAAALTPVPENLKDLIQSEIRRTEWHIINLQTGVFNLQDIMNELHELQINVGPNSVQQFLTALTIRKVLTASSMPREKQLGRTKLQYSLAISPE